MRNIFIPKFFHFYKMSFYGESLVKAFLFHMEFLNILFFKLNYIKIFKMYSCLKRIKLKLFYSREIPSKSFNAFLVSVLILSWTPFGSLAASFASWAASAFALASSASASCPHRRSSRCTNSASLRSLFAPSSTCVSCTTSLQGTWIFRRSSH